jgi:hypothetical protein
MDAMEKAQRRGVTADVHEVSDDEQEQEVPREDAKEAQPPKLRIIWALIDLRWT